MAITIVGTATHADVAGAGNIDTITIPTGVQAGDGLLLFLSYPSSAITSTRTDNGLSAPLTQVGGAASFSGHQSQLWSAPNLAPADAGKVITFTQSANARFVAVAVVYRGASKTALVNAFASKMSTAAVANPSTPTVVTTVAGCAELGFIAPSRGASTPQIATITPPAGTTLGPVDAEPALGAANTTGGAVLVAEGHNLTGATNGATVGGDTYTLDVGAAYSAWTVALAPSSTGPVVDAGAAQTVAAGATVTLAGTESAAAGTTISSRTWTALTYPGTTAPTLTGATTGTATFTSVPGKYTFRYRVTDSAGAVADDTTTVYATTSTARPVGTPTTGPWTPVGAATIHDALADESTGTYAEAVAPSGASFTVDVAPSPIGAKTINYSLVDDVATPAGTYLVEYLSGGVVVASWNETIGSTLVARARALTDTQNAAVSDPLNQQLRFTGTAG